MFINQSYVIIDFETANNKPNSICQVGMVKVKNSEVIATFETLIKPNPLYFSSQNIAVHNIKASDVINAPTFEEVFEDMLSFIGNYQLVAHFAQFDFKCLEYTLMNTKFNYHFEFACSCRIAKELIPSESHSLTYLSKNITNFEYKAHDALEDCLATYHLLKYCFSSYDVPSLINNKYQLGILNKTGYRGFVYKKNLKNQ